MEKVKNRANILMEEIMKTIPNGSLIFDNKTLTKRVMELISKRIFFELCLRATKYSATKFIMDINEFEKIKKEFSGEI